MDIAYDKVLQMMDVAMLEPTTTFSQIRGLAQAAIDEGFGQICIHSLHVRAAADVLGRSAPKIVACVGFPMGVVDSRLKAAETEQAIADGAHEIDMVLSHTAFLDGDLRRTEEDIRAVIRAAAGAPVKVIIEACFLNRRQKAEASLLVQAAGAAFVKTSTGFSPDPAAMYEDVKLIRETVGPAMGVKAAGRIRNYHRFISMVEAGANRIGLSLPGARESVRGWKESHP
ncbi:MAG: deoxyribose-phosphate aldolase [Planctomycetia bacterium]|nr:deoxyribose-phosphate aldolase [Planctomycetia bacterium]